MISGKVAAQDPVDNSAKVGWHSCLDYVKVA